MDPALYLLLEPNVFVIPVSPGNTPTYPAFASQAIIKNIDNVFDHDCNYFLLYVNINQACFTMLDDTVSDRYKVSNTPKTHWMEFFNVHPQDHRPNDDKLWRSGCNGHVQ